MAIFAPGPSLVVANNLVQATFDCDASAAVGDLVIQSTTTDNKVDVISSNVYDGLVIGVVVEKLGDTKCNIRWSGLTGQATGLTRNERVFVSLIGKPTTLVPTTGHMQVIGTAISATEFLININQNKLDAVSGDYHAGYGYIPAGEEITIDANKQSRILSEVKMQGSLIITGHLIID